MYDFKELRFGVLFSGGTAAGMNVTLEHLWRYCRRAGARLIGFKHGWEGLYKHDIIDIDEDFINQISLTSGGAPLGSCSKVNVFNINGKDYSGNCNHNYRALRLNGIFVLGGDGTMRQANELSEKFPGMKFFWISATLDRDVANCDETIGFHTAVEQAAETIANMAIDGETMSRCTITQCMGRHSGWVTTAAVDRALRLHGGKNRIKVDIVLIPEIPFSIDAICDRISTSNTPLNIVISEGIPLDDSINEPEAVAGHHHSLACTGEKLAAILSKHSKFPIKTQIVGYRQRTGPLSGGDEFLAMHCAELAVEKAIEGNNSQAIFFAGNAFQSIPMKEMVEKSKDAQKDKAAQLLSDPVIFGIRDQLSAGACQAI